jgi:DNA-binding MarR family transcriptional regulator
MISNLSSQQVLEIWRDSLVEGVRRDGPDLTARQLALMLTVYLKPLPHTVRGLSAELNIGKPAVTRALDALTKYSFVRRIPDPDDKRSIQVQRTVKGSIYLVEYADRVVEAIKDIERD